MVKEEKSYTDPKGRVYPMIVLGADEKFVVQEEPSSKRKPLKRCKINNRSDKRLLFMGCKSGDLDLVKEAIRETSVNIRYEFCLNQTPLHIAAEEGFEQIVGYLLTHDPAIDARDKEGCTTLFLAVFQKDAFITDLLCKAGADVNLQNDEGEAPLHEAVRTKSFPCVTVLLNSNEIKVNKPNKDGDTPLHIALREYESSGDSKNIIKSLLQHGADLRLHNNEKKAPRTVATKQAQLFLKIWDRQKSKSD